MIFYYCKNTKKSVSFLNKKFLKKVLLFRKNKNRSKTYPPHKRMRFWMFRRKRGRWRKNKFKYNFKGRYKKKKRKKYLKPLNYIKFVKKLFIFNLSERFITNKYINPKKYFYSQLFNNLRFNLMFILNSANFCNNFYYLRHFIKQGNILVNGIIIYNPFFLIKNWDIITVSLHARELFARKWKKNIKPYKKYIYKTKYQYFYVKKAHQLFYQKKKAKRQLFQQKKAWKTSKFTKKFRWYLIKYSLNNLFSYPKYMEVSYKLFSIIIIRKPKIKELYIPFNFWNLRPKQKASLK